MKTIAEQLLVFDNSLILHTVSKNKDLEKPPHTPPGNCLLLDSPPLKIFLPSERVWIFSGLDITLEAKICAWNMPNYNLTSLYSIQSQSFPWKLFSRASACHIKKRLWFKRPWQKCQAQLHKAATCVLNIKQD